MDISEFDYSLPEELIAQKAAHPKDSSRLLVLRKNGVSHQQFSDLAQHIRAGDVIVINETRVAKALIRGRKATGSPVSLILEQMLAPDTWICRIAVNKVRIGNIYCFDSGLQGRVIGIDDDRFTVRFNCPLSAAFIHERFELPSPPYIKKIIGDQEYQTTYARTVGSLAAPTAGLHFTPGLMAEIEQRGASFARICLHVGFGTFLPLRGDIERHTMHSERFEISERAAETINSRAGRLFVVGTTSLRTLESCADKHGIIHPSTGSTDLFIYPGYHFKTPIAGLITNFHLPRSTLLLLVSALAGKDRILSAYHEAVAMRYRFYSLGDAMLILT